MDLIRMIPLMNLPMNSTISFVVNQITYLTHLISFMDMMEANIIRKKEGQIILYTSGLKIPYVYLLDGHYGKLPKHHHTFFLSLPFINTIY